MFNYKHNTKQLFLNMVSHSFIILVIRIFGLLAGFGVMILLTRNLPQESVGRITTGFSLTMVLSVLIILNYESTALKYLSKHLVEKNNSRIISYLKTGNKINIISVIVVSFTVFFIYLLNKQNINTIPHYVTLALIGSVLFGWLRIESSFVYAKGHIFIVHISKKLLRFVILFILVAIAIITQSQLTPTLVMILFITSLLVAAIFQWLYRIKIYGNYEAIKQEDTILQKEVIIFGLVTLLPTLFLELSNDLMVIIASTMISKPDIAVFGIAARISSISFFAVSSVNMAILPKLSRMIHRNNTSDMYYLLDISTLIKLSLALSVILGMFLFAPEILAIFGKEYTIGTTTLIILSFIPLAYVISGPVIFFVTLMELQNYLTPVFLSSLAIMYALAFILSKHFGLTGIALTSLFVVLYWNIVLSILVYKKKGYNISIFGTLGRLLKCY